MLAVGSILEGGFDNAVSRLGSSDYNSFSLSGCLFARSFFLGSLFCGSSINRLNICGFFYIAEVERYKFLIIYLVIFFGLEKKLVDLIISKLGRKLCLNRYCILGLFNDLTRIGFFSCFRTV